MDERHLVLALVRCFCDTSSIMRLDTSRLDAKIRKYQLLKEMLSDPEMVSACLEIISGNGHKPTEPAKTLAKGTPSERATTERGSLFEAAKQVAGGFTVKFSSRDLLTQLKASGYTLAAKREDVAISGVLKRLVEHGVIAKSGTRGKTRFEVIR